MMAKEKKKVPNLRFKGFTDDWEQHKLGDALEEFSYGLNTPATKFDGKNKYLRITDIDDDTHAFNQTSLTSPKDKDDNYILGQGDILFARTGASVGKTYMYKANDGKVYYAGFLIKGHIKNGFSTEFIFNTTRLPQYQNFVKVTSMRSGQPGINAKEYQNYVIYVPVKQEQERIGQLISKLDTLITLHQRKLDLLNQLKNGFLQKMFADKDSKRPVLQFKIFHDDWEQRKLGDLIKEFSIKSKIEDEYKVLSSTNSGMKFREGRVTGTSNLGYKIIKNGDLVLSPQNLWLGNININNIGKGLVSPSYKTFKLINIDSSFINPQLRTQKMLEEYKNSSTQGASVVRRNLEIDSFYQIKIFVPTISEQEKIGSFFQRLDNTIVLQHQKLAKCQLVKKSLLQQMFI